MNATLVPCMPAASRRRSPKVSDPGLAAVGDLFCSKLLCRRGCCSVLGDEGEEVEDGVEGWMGLHWEDVVGWKG